VGSQNLLFLGGPATNVKVRDARSGENPSLCFHLLRMGLAGGVCGQASIGRKSTFGAGIADGMLAPAISSGRIPHWRSSLPVRRDCTCPRFPVPSHDAKPLKMKVYDSERVEVRHNLAYRVAVSILQEQPTWNSVFSLESSQHSLRGFLCSS
jgi:hypothetical protein